MEKLEFIKGLSSVKLRELSKDLLKLAADLEAEEPSDKLAILHGIKDNGYNTTANGWIDNYSGECIVTMDNGSKWRCIGHWAGGDAWHAINGYIEKIKLSD